MIRIGIIGDIGSGKTFVANNFGYPVFNADYEVSKLYQKDKKIFVKLKKKLPKYISNFPINKKKNILEKANIMVIVMENLLKNEEENINEFYFIVFVLALNLC